MATAQLQQGDKAASSSSRKKSSKNKDKHSNEAENVTLTNEDIPVPQANEDDDAVETAEEPSTTEKTKKRKRKDGQDDIATEEGNSSTKEKKKKKKKDKNESIQETGTIATAAEDNTIPPTDNAQQQQQEESSAVANESAKKQKKKSKKDKASTGEDAAGQVDHDDNTAATESGMQVDGTATEGQDIEGTEGGDVNAKNKKKKKKRKDKEEGQGADTEEGNAEGDSAERKKKKKEKKEKKEKKKMQDAQQGVDTATGSAGTNNADMDARDRQASSALPEIRIPPLPTSTSSTTAAANANSNTPDFENIDPALWPTSDRLAVPPPAATTTGRSTSVSGSTSILPRDPSMGPSTTGSIAPGGEPINPSQFAPDGGAPGTSGSQAPKKRGRPKKVVVSEPAAAGIIPASLSSATIAPQPIAPAPAPVTSATSNDVGRSAIASTSQPPARPPSSSTIAPSSFPPPLPPSSSPLRSAIPTSITSAIDRPTIPPSTSAPAPAPAASARPPSSVLNMPGVNPNTAARAAMNPNFVPATLPEGTTPLQPSENTAHHQELLAVRWLSTKEMAELIEKEGLKVRTGKFSKAEDAALKLCIQNYREQQGLTQEQIDGIIFAKGRNTRADYGDFWTILTRSVPDRALMSVYHHTKRIMQSGARKGPWTEEEDEKLKAAYKQYGPSWIKISTIVGRWENDCRDRWRAYVGPNEKITKGKWSKEEEDKLRYTIQQVKHEIFLIKKKNHTLNGEPIEDEPPGGSDMFWSRVASKMGTRSRHQCRIKWNDHMRNKLLTPDGKPIRWAKRDTFILIMKLDSLQLTDEDEIAWKLLPDSHWNWWSPHVLHKRWGTMKSRAKKHLKNDKATYKEIVAWLKKEQDSIPRKEVKAFMAKKPGEPDNDADSAGDDEEDGDGEAEEDLGNLDLPEESSVGGNTAQSSATSSRPQKKKGGKSTPNGVSSSGTSTSAAALAKKKASSKDQSQFRTNEFINSSDEED